MSTKEYCKVPRLSKQRHVVNFSLPVFTTQSKPFSVIVNPAFNKSSKGFDSISKSQTEKPNKFVASWWCCTQKTQTSNLFERRENFDVCQATYVKKPAKTKYFRRSKIFENHLDSNYISNGLYLLKNLFHSRLVGYK